MDDNPTYRVIASREGGFREVVARGLTETAAQALAKEMRELGWPHSFQIEGGIDPAAENAPRRSSGAD